MGVCGGCEWALLWCPIIMVDYEYSACLCILFASILAQWMASRVVLWSGGNAMHVPIYLEDCALPKEPNSMSRLWGEL